MDGVLSRPLGVPLTSAHCCSASLLALCVMVDPLWLLSELDTLELDQLQESFKSGGFGTVSTSVLTVSCLMATSHM